MRQSFCSTHVARCCQLQSTAATKGKQSNIERRRRQTAPANKIYTTVIIHYPCPRCFAQSCSLPCKLLWIGIQFGNCVCFRPCHCLGLLLLLFLRFVMRSSLAAFGAFINFSLAVQTVLCPAYAHTHTCINVCGHSTQ